MADQEKPATQSPAQQKALDDFATFAAELSAKAVAVTAQGMFDVMLSRISEYVTEYPNTIWQAESALRGRWSELEAHLRLGHASAIEQIMLQTLMALRNSAPDPYVSRRIPPQGHNLLGR